MERDRLALVPRRLKIVPILTDPREERFAQERAKGVTQIKAFTLAGFPPDDGHASRLNSKPEVKARIAELLERAAKRVEITQAMVLAELAKIGFSDIRKLFTPGGNLLPIHDLDDDTAACLSSIEVVTRKAPGGEEAEVEHVAKIKLWDKKGALVDIGKHLGMFKEGLPDPTQVNVNIGDSELARLIVFQLQKAAKAGD